MTENGITRWLAFHTENILSLVEFKEITLAEVLSLEEERTNYKFIPRSTSIRDAENLFLKEPALEALLITENGRANERLLGIITTWDIVKF